MLMTPTYAAPDPGGPAYDPWWRHWCDDDEDGEDAESHDAWFESHYTTKASGVIV